MRFLALFFALFAVAGPVAAQGPGLRIGAVLPLSGSDAGVGQQIRDGLSLGLRAIGSETAVELLVEDDRSEPAAAAAAVKKLLEKEPPPFLIGPVATSHLMAAIKPAADAGAILFSAGTGPAALAGRQCSANTFTTLWQNDQPVEAIARSIEEAGGRRIAVVFADDTVGREVAELIKKHVRGDVLTEVRLPVDSSDMASVMPRILAGEPQAVVIALKGQTLTSLVGLIAAESVLARTAVYALQTPEAPVAGSSAPTRDVLTTTVWAPGLDNPENVAFLKAFEEAYGYVPGPHAVAGFDAGQLIVAAYQRLRGVLTDKAAVRAALRQVQIKSPRGRFSFANNNMPVQDFYLIRNSVSADGKPRADIVRQVFSQYGDAYASECTLR